MASQNTPRFLKGERLSAAKLNAIADAVDRAGNTWVSGGASAGFGTVLAPDVDPYFWAKVTEVGETDPDTGWTPHAFVEVVEDPDTTEFIQAAEGVLGTLDPFFMPLYDINNRSVAVDTVVKAWRGAGDY